ncbi:MAG: hypothetical protein ABSA06_10270 [Geobacteraceae bacterium]|jgi:hypothetical protein
MPFVVENHRRTISIETAEITEFSYTVEGIHEKIKARITESLDKDNDWPFYWEVSHDYDAFPDKPTSLMSPSSRNGRTFDEAYESMRAYLQNMTPHLRLNEQY